MSDGILMPRPHFWANVCVQGELSHHTDALEVRIEIGILTVYGGIPLM